MHAPARRATVLLVVAAAATGRGLPVAAAPKRIRFLYSDTGGGHRASALALQGALQDLYPEEIECDMVDAFVEAGRWPFCEYPKIYTQLAAVPWLWKLVAFDFGATPFGIAFNDWIMDVVCRNEFRRLLEASPKPDLVVSVHPLLNRVPLLALEDADGGGSRTTPFATVVTDLGSAHPSWFDREADRCFVPSDVLRSLAASRGLTEAQLEQYGLPIRPAFGRGGHRTKDEWRAEIGLQTGLPTVLLVGGGDGMGGLAAFAQAVGRRLGEEADPGRDEGQPSTQMVVVCGRNEQAVATLEATAWSPNVHVCVRGFVTNMDEHMAAADLLVTKAGPGTIAEASATGLPCILNSFLPGQEEGNVDFVRDSGFGEYRDAPEEVAHLVVEYLSDPPRLEEMSRAALAAGRPEATANIAKGLASLVLD